MWTMLYKQNVPLKVLTSFGTNLSHFSWMNMNEMKPRSILLSKSPILVLVLLTTSFKMNFDPKWRDISAESDNIPFQNSETLQSRT